MTASQRVAYVRYWMISLPALRARRPRSDKIPTPNACTSLAACDPKRTSLSPDDQKSGLSARGASANFPGYQNRFSAQDCSCQSSRPLPTYLNVIVEVHGVVKTF